MRSFAAALIQVPDQTQSVLRALKSKGKKIGLISNADVMEVAAWSRCPVADLFDSTVFSCSVGWAKPEAEIYEIALKELAVIPSEAIFVGDGGSDELQGASERGHDGCHDHRDRFGRYGLREFPSAAACGFRDRETG